MSETCGQPGESGIRLGTYIVDNDWLDYNGHMNVAYYTMIFDRATDRLFDLIGIGRDYTETRRQSVFALDAHITYQQELKAGQTVRLSALLLDHDDKRLHFFMHLFEQSSGRLSSTFEQLAIHVDMDSRRACPFPDNIRQNLAIMKKQHEDWPRPQEAGRIIGIRR